MVEENIQQHKKSDELSKNLDKKADAMKALRKSCKNRIDRVAEIVREQKRALKAIRAQLANSPSTIPEIAASTAMPTDIVLWYVAAMKKYGQIAEKEKDDGYYRYSLQGESHVID